MDIKKAHPIGYVYCQIREDSRAWWGTDASIRIISVLPEHRNLGVGSALMASAFDFLRKNGVQIVGTATETAEDFYKKLGFKVDGRYVQVRKRI